MSKKYKNILYCDRDLEFRLVDGSDHTLFSDHTIIDCLIKNRLTGKLYCALDVIELGVRAVAYDVIELNFDMDSDGTIVTNIDPGSKLSDEAESLLYDLSFGAYSHVHMPKPKEKSKQKAKRLTRIKQEDLYKPPTLDEDGFYVESELWYFLLWSVLEKNQVLLVGEAGTGKTSLPNYVVKAVNRRRASVGRKGLPIHYFDMMTSNPEAEFKGSLRVLNKQTFFQEARFAKVIQSEGLTVLNEINRGTKATQNMFMSVLDDQRVLHVEKADGDKNIGVDKRHSFIATANIGSKYSGTTSIDPAVARRFDYIELTFPPVDIEAKVLISRARVTVPQARVIVDIASAIRDSKNIVNKVSTADLLKIAQKVHSGYRITQAYEFTVLNRYEADSIDGGERGRIRTIINSK